MSDSKVPSKWDVNAYEAHTTGSITIYLEDQYGENMMVRIAPHDVTRLMYAAIDALERVNRTR